MKDDSERLAVQFMHPGREKINHSNANGCLNSHGRKFVRGRGNYITGEGSEITHEPIMFWCEYEYPLCYKELSGWPPSGNRQYPRYLQELERVHYTQVNHQAENTRCINTDPYVFGDYMLYSNCRQRVHHCLRNLAPGSIIVFGSRINWHFCLDTVFVVSEILCKFKTNEGGMNELEKLKGNGIISENFWQATIEPLFAEKRLQNEEYTLYKSATYQNPINNMYSFFPCKPLDDRGFPRPIITDSHISERLGQGVSFLSTIKTDKNYSDFWKFLRRDVFKNGLCVGTMAEEPTE